MNSTDPKIEALEILFPTNTNKEYTQEEHQINKEIDYFLPPENFSMVTPFIYRSGFPKKKNFSFLKKIKIKSIL